MSFNIKRYFKDDDRIKWSCVPQMIGDVVIFNIVNIEVKMNDIEKGERINDKIIGMTFMEYGIKYDIEMKIKVKDAQFNADDVLSLLNVDMNFNVKANVDISKIVVLLPKNKDIMFSPDCERIINVDVKYNDLEFNNFTGTMMYLLFKFYLKYPETTDLIDCISVECPCVVKGVPKGPNQEFKSSVTPKEISLTSVKQRTMSRVLAYLLCRYNMGTKIELINHYSIGKSNKLSCKRKEIS
jgi:hypothetical protein